MFDLWSLFQALDGFMMVALLDGMIVYLSECPQAPRIQVSIPSHNPPWLTHAHRHMYTFPLRQLLLLVWLPPPHVTEQPLQFDQVPQFAGTVWNIIYWCHNVAYRLYTWNDHERGKVTLSSLPLPLSENCCQKCDKFYSQLKPNNMFSIPKQDLVLQCCCWMLVPSQ